MMLFVYILIGFLFSLFAVIVSMKISVGKIIREEFFVEQEWRDDVLKSKTTNFLFKNFIEIALIPNLLSSVITLVQFIYFSLLIYSAYSGKWIFGICYLFIVAVSSKLLGKISQVKSVVILMFYRELHKKMHSGKLSSSEKNVVEKMIRIFDHKIM